MLEYALFMIMLQNEVESFYSIGEFYLNKNLHNLISHKNIKIQTNSTILLLHELSYTFVSNYIENISENTQWIIVTPEPDENLLWLYSSLKNKAQFIYYDDQNRIIILKNITKSNNHEKPPKQFIDDFLDIKIVEKEKLYEYSFDDLELQLAKSLISQAEYFYFGKEITEQDLTKCQMIAKSFSKIIECKCGNEVFGYFVHFDLKEKLWISLLYPSNILKNVLNVEKYKLSVQIKRK